MRSSNYQNLERAKTGAQASSVARNAAMAAGGAAIGAAIAGVMIYLVKWGLSSFFHDSVRARDAEILKWLEHAKKTGCESVEIFWSDELALPISGTYAGVKFTCAANLRTMVRLKFTFLKCGTSEVKAVDVSVA